MGDVEIPNWLKELPFAPEFRPTDTEFADPIAYISKIEKQASAFGICKVIPPLPKPSKRYVFCNLNTSLSKCPELGEDVGLSNVSSSSRMGFGDNASDGEVRAVFTTRHQELGLTMKRMKGLVKENSQLGVHKQVWQSGEIYTLEQFESKSKAFARNVLGMTKEVNPLVTEALFWKAASEKPTYVEYANDVPGSGFGEPEGQFRYFCRRRRKRASYQSYRRSRENPDYKKNEIASLCNSHNEEAKGGSEKNDTIMPLEIMPGPSMTSATSFSEENLRSSKRKIVNASNDMEGTAGWKLSNSPWNLQVIARSPGSLTRFMPDDIPGVTSPMVYIGMLFSWFAWHVEDHELHSMNFLHTGSPKTWYAVPGDYAFAFEEVIRTEAYGGNIDRLAALTLLGEKTTLLSPDIVVSSGIPCCRLVQNPGEFVVTFPRAYHLGFSHGFNCGEAANFGTPQWLKVAKEAAVRRAAMNYLPMLSHQQLLYLLTMSFVSRVPRSLLPGARSSRLRDRQKEERELSVKRAFIEDMLKENVILSALLRKDSRYRAVIWSPHLLPCASKESQVSSAAATEAATPKENVSHTHSDNSNSNENDLYKEMTLYMETLNDLYSDDDLSCDFQVDSGTLACVGCGILGFPFMSVVQPTEGASAEFLPVDHHLVEGGPEVTKSEIRHSSADPDATAKGSVSGDLPPLHDLSRPLKDLPMPKWWNTSNKILRPRIFCLEHGIQIEELLQSKGGANMLIICHSDFQKIKAHATSIAEEIESPFNYIEAPMENASQEELNLIDLAIDDEDHHECGEDWTSKLGINLQYCVKVRKNSPSKQVQHALALGGLFSDKNPSSGFLNIQWQSKRSRSRIKLNQLAHFKACETKKGEVLGIKSKGVEKKEKLIQYTRRKYKVKIDYSTIWGEGCTRNHLATEVSISGCEDLDKHNGNSAVINPCRIQITGGGSAGTDHSPIRISGVLHEVPVLEATGKRSFSCAPSQVGGSPLTATIAIKTMGQSEGQLLEVSNMESDTLDNAHNLAACRGSEMQHEVNSGVISENEESDAKKFCNPLFTAADGRFELQGGRQMAGNANNINEPCNTVSEGQNQVQADRDVPMNEVFDLANTESLRVSKPLVGQIVDVVVEISCTDGNEVPQELQTKSRNNGDRCILHDDLQINQLSASVDKRCKLGQETCAAGEKMQQQIEVASGSKEEEHILTNVRIISQPTVAPSEIQTKPCAVVKLLNSATLEDDVQQEERILTNVRIISQPTVAPSEIQTKPCAVVKLLNSATLEDDVQLAIQINDERNEKLDNPDSCPVAQMEVDQPIRASVEEFSRGTSAQEDLSSGLTFESELQLEIQTTDRSDLEELVPNSATKEQEDLCNPVSVEECSEVPRRSCASEDLSAVVNLDTEVQQVIQSDEVVSDDGMENVCQTTSSSSKEEPVSTRVVQINQLIPAPIKTYSVIEDESCAGEDMVKGNEVCSLQELEGIDSAVIDPRSTAGKGRKRKNELEQITESKFDYNGFIRSPCEGLRPRTGKDAASRKGINIIKSVEENPVMKRSRKPSDISNPPPKKKVILKRSHKCDLEGCCMSFETKAQLMLHKRNRCTHEGCRKRFSSHKYAIIHQRVHEDERPLKCPWKGCSMSFKWAWARTEHIRVHTGEKPYQCKVEGCGLSFRFVSDYSRHRRKMGHYVNTPA